MAAGDSVRMSITADDPGYLRAQKRLLDEIEHGIRAANRALIHERVPGLDRDAVLRLAAVVARLRAEYLGAALGLGRDRLGAAASDAEIETLRQKRLRYEEGVAAFGALQRAVTRGYIDLGG